MEKNYEIYKVGNSGNIEINKVKEKDPDGYITGATKELVETLLCEVKWEVKKLELEIKKVRFRKGVKSDEKEELKMELLREQSLCREFIKGIDRVICMIREIYNEKNESNDKLHMKKKIENLKIEKEYLKDILIKQMSTYCVLKSLHNENKANMGNNFIIDSNENKNSIQMNNLDLEEDVVSYFDVFPQKYSISNLENTDQIPFNNKFMKERIEL
ncbi:hypothetical protein ChUKH1_12185 [Cryptosporidium hominis]|uniref:Striatin N-terminal domain-containing protein n=2 Tax=Cryptosporidium hominis TaxID=237895 RepID=A0ABX5BFG4_CRYHO|nr:hypothetical protein ChTU502y2012_390g0015 [Cryptosporidium hominis]PPA62629.1 hypothetical protein ChUKH1_12185 [Cryptosporidium hominis]PPS95188.1 Uncharacterized protein GY17_00002270 [Cryptosporidium hominis]|eukprot:PPS95188.1 Uncharacterized protein GY17_00002270 [Cryptosporidium hominis]